VKNNCSAAVGIALMKPSLSCSCLPLLRVAIASVTFALMGASARAADYVVTNINDSGAGSLRAAILLANASAESDTIIFDETVFAAPRKTITLGGTQLDIVNNGSLTITAPNAGVIVSGNNASRVFNVTSGANVTMSGLTIANGRDTSSDGGGGIRVSESALTLTNCIVRDNTAVFGGGTRPRYHWWLDHGPWLHPDRQQRHAGWCSLCRL
jgi:hypothetical protein